jgi:hypothetical protein
VATSVTYGAVLTVREETVIVRPSALFQGEQVWSPGGAEAYVELTDLSSPGRPRCREAVRNASAEQPPAYVANTEPVPAARTR